MIQAAARLPRRGGRNITSAGRRVFLDIFVLNKPRLGALSAFDGTFDRRPPSSRSQHGQAGLLVQRRKALGLSLKLNPPRKNRPLLWHPPELRPKITPPWKCRIAGSTVFRDVRGRSSEYLIPPRSANLGPKPLRRYLLLDEQRRRPQRVG